MMGAQVSWVLLFLGSMASLGCGGDSFEPGSLHGGPGAQDTTDSLGAQATGGNTIGSSPSNTPAGGQSTGGSAATPGMSGASSGREMPRVGTGGMPSVGTGGMPSVGTGGAAATLTGGAASAGSTGSGGVSICLDGGVPSLERVVASCVADERTRARLNKCANTLEESWRSAVGTYMACTDCDQVNTQFDCLLRACDSDADGALTVQELVDNCAGTLMASGVLY